MTVTSANGKICYLEIPADDVERSARFYGTVFGWKMRRRGDGATAFDDPVEVSGAFVTGRPPSREAGVLTYVMVADIAATIELIVAHGGEIVQPPVMGAPETVARFRDPAGNVLGLYEEKALGREGGSR
jgi:predicted enzyme related to lactoylglutathione lyase